jgi:hypothetical protein
MSPDVFDDDRLLRYALGLDDDPGLTQALEGDARLRERLAAVQRELDAVGDRLRAATPVAAADTDPGDTRWARLRPYFDGAAGGRRRSPRRRLAAALAAAAVVAVVAAIVVAGPLHTSTTGTSEKGPVLAPGSNAMTGAGSAADGAYRGELSPSLLPASGYGDVVVARAGKITGAAPAARRQAFTVVRSLKGDLRGRFVLSVGPAVQAAAPGSLQVVYLRPAARAGESESPGGTSQPAAPIPSPAAGAAYSFQGSPATVVALPASVDPRALSLP